MKPSDQISQLRSELHEHTFRYYTLDAPTISDAEFDRKLQELRLLETQWPEYADPNSPTQRVGGVPVDGFEKVAHSIPMLSIDNAFTCDQVADWIEACGLGNDLLVCEPKVDGLALSLAYKNGELIRAVTRGNGATGDDVTQNARAIASIPILTSTNFTGEVRGEVYMSRAVFAELNAALAEQGEDQFANPRNAASGTMKSRDSATVAARKLSFIAYRLVDGKDLISHTDAMEYLEQLRFKTAPSLTGVGVAVMEPARIFEHYASTRSALDYEIDGVVVKVNSLYVQEQCGEGSKFVNWAIAYKFPPEQVCTKVNSITVQIGRRGTLTPVAELEPVHVAGTTVSRATLCNQDQIDRLGLGIGDTVVVQKAGEIIPEIVAVKVACEKHIPYKIPSTCPGCGMPVSRMVCSDGSEGVALVCTNHHGCQNQIVQQLSHAFGKGALDVLGLGESMINTVLASGHGKKLSDWFSMDESVVLRVFGTAKGKKFLKEREKAKAAPMWRKINALGIEHIGATLSKQLSSRYSSIIEIAEASKEELTVMLGPVATQALQSYILEEASEIERLEILGFSFTSEKKVGKLTGKTFVITGELARGPRGKVSAQIEEIGGTVKSSVGKAVDYLVVGDGAGASKATAAAKYGIRTISEDELCDLAGWERTSANASILDAIADEF